MRKIVIAVGQGRAGNIEHRRADAFEHEGDGARGVGLEREPRQVIHHLHFLHVFRGILRINRARAH